MFRFSCTIVVILNDLKKIRKRKWANNEKENREKKKKKEITS